jgi:sulfate adenylyltransferase subunit 2
MKEINSELENQPEAFPPRTQAVLLKMSGHPLQLIAQMTGLSAPTISKLYKAYLSGGWAAVEGRAHPGRPKGGAKGENDKAANLLSQLLGDRLPLKPYGKLFSSKELANWMSEITTKRINERAAIRRLADWGILPPSQPNEGGCLYLSEENGILWARGPRAEIYIMPIDLPHTDQTYLAFIKGLFNHLPNGFTLALDFAGLGYTPDLNGFLKQNESIRIIIKEKVAAMKPQDMTSSLPAESKDISGVNRNNMIPDHNAKSPAGRIRLSHLQRLEAESIQIIREVAADSDNPVMLYSIGKDSAVLLRLALKAFYPAKIPFPLLHVDTTWKFQDMYRFRERMQAEHDFKLLIHTNAEGLANGINPFTHGSQIHTDIMKTQALRQALDLYQFDVALGGARRDEEKSRAKERVFSFRTKDHRWDPKNQRPELWQLYNTKKHKGESIRVFPISNWTELDIWQYIYIEDIPIVPLYFSAPRPVVNRNGVLIMVDDDRLPLAKGEVPMIKSVRFRTLGCYPLTGAVESTATSLEEVIQETLLTKTSERQGRIIDHDSAASMEKKKQEGYF